MFEKGKKYTATDTVEAFDIIKGNEYICTDNEGCNGEIEIINESGLKDWIFGGFFE